MKKISELPDCPVETALVLMGDRWKMLIVRDLLERTMRFGELQRSVGHISRTMSIFQRSPIKTSAVSTGQAGSSEIFFIFFITSNR